MERHAESDRSLRILMVRYHLMASDVGEALQAAGAQVRWLEPRALSVKGFQQAVMGFRPHLLLSINFAPELAFLSTHFQLPYVSWTIDPLPMSRTRLLEGTDPACCLCFVHHRALLQVLQRAGLRHLHYLPLAAARRRVATTRCPTQLAPYQADVSFVGSSLLEEDDALRSSLQAPGAPAPEAVSRFLSEVWARQRHDLSFQGVQLEGVPAGLRAACASDEALWVERFNGRLAHWHRRDTIASIDDLGVHVWGDPYWGKISSNYRGIAQHEEELTLVYRASRLSLDLPRIYQRDIITLRAFDVLAAGGLLLTEAGGELARLMGELCCTYRDVADLRNQIEYWLGHESEARERAAAGARWVMREHCLEHRLEAILRGAGDMGFLGPHQDVTF